MVASEVRNLAAQTVQATESISAQIMSLKESSGKSVTAVADIVKVIQEIDRNTASIATAMDQQGSVTQEVARNAATAAGVGANLIESVANVSGAAQEIGLTAQRLAGVLTTMDDDFKKLNDQVGEFLSSIA